MEIQYERQANRSYMVLTGQTEVGGIEEKMLRENDVRFLLPFYTVSVRDELQYWYDITGLVSMRDYISETAPTADTVRRFFRLLAIIFEEANKFLIEETHLYLTADTVFVETKSDGFSLRVCFFPDGNRETIGATIRATDAFLSCFEAAGAGNDELSALLNDLRNEAKNPNVTFSDLSEIAAKSAYGKEEEREEIYVEKVVLSASASASEVASEEDALLRYDEEEYLDEDAENDAGNKSGGIFETIKTRAAEWIARFLNRTKREDKEAAIFEISPDDEIYEPTVLLSDGGYSEDETVSGGGCSGRLIYEGDGAEKDISIAQELFRVGKQRDNDAVLRSAAVSRHHARLTREGSRLFVQDLNSTNGTIVNGDAIPYHEKRELFPADKIVFGDVPYRVG